MTTRLSETEIEQLVEQAKEAALNAACLHIQEAFGQTDGGLAGMHFSVENPFDDFTLRLTAYIKDEMQLAQQAIDTSQP